jgi:hypothetical protein
MSHKMRHILSGAGLFTAITMLTGTSPSQTVYQYQCGAGARLADNFILVPEAPTLFFSVDIPIETELQSDWPEGDTGLLVENGITSVASFQFSGRYMTGAADSPNENITLTLSKWQTVADDLCDETGSEDSGTDTGVQPDTGDTGSDTGSDMDGDTLDDSFQFSWVDGECYGWHEFQSIPLEAIAAENSAAFAFEAVFDEPWGREVIFRLALDGNGHASIDFKFTHTLYEGHVFETSPGPRCGGVDKPPERSETRDAELCSMLQVESWSWTEEEDPTP